MADNKQIVAPVVMVATNRAVLRFSVLSMSRASSSSLPALRPLRSKDDTVGAIVVDEMESLLFSRAATPTGMEGAWVGTWVGADVGIEVGTLVGRLVGTAVGLAEGVAEGEAVGTGVGKFVGACETVGTDVGAMVGTTGPHSHSHAYMRHLALVVKSLHVVVGFALS